MPKTSVNCPNCRQPLTADIEQIFDVGVDPSAKQKIISGGYNFIQCNRCGYQGNLSTMIVYHDPSKELLLTFVPAELGLPRNDQERLLGSLITQVVNRLPQEQRKGYLLRPQSTLTMQGLVERVLQEDGITREMIQAQQQKLNLIQRLLSATSPDVRSEIAKQEDKLIDAEFFTLISRIADAAMAGGDQNSAQQLASLQQELLPITTFGRELQEQSREVEAAVASLQEIGENLDRESLLELVIKAPNEIRLQALVGLARPGMDYQFFQILSDRIDRAQGDGRIRLINLRETLLKLTQEIDRQQALRRNASQKLLEKILTSPNVEEALEANLGSIDDYFLQEVNRSHQAAREQGDLEKSSKLQKIVEMLQRMSAPPPEVAFFEELVEMEDDQQRLDLLKANQDKLTPEFMSTLSSIASQVEAGEDQELARRVKEVYRQILRYSMEVNLGR